MGINTFGIVMECTKFLNVQLQLRKIFWWHREKAGGQMQHARNPWQTWQGWQLNAGQTWVCKDTPPSCPHSRPQLVELEDALLGSKPCLVAKLVQCGLNPLREPGFFGALQNDPADIEEVPGLQSSSERSWSTVMLMSLVSQWGKWLAGNATPKNLHIRSCCMDLPQNSAVIDVPLDNCLEWLHMLSKPGAVFCIHVIEANNWNPTMFEAGAASPNSRANFNRCQWSIEVRNLDR